MPFANPNELNERVVEGCCFATNACTMRAHESLFSIVNITNVSREATSCTEQFVARWARVFVRFVRIVQSIDVVSQRIGLVESFQTMWTLRSIWSIENRFLALHERHCLIVFVLLPFDRDKQSASQPTFNIQIHVNRNRNRSRSRPT